MRFALSALVVALLAAFAMAAAPHKSVIMSWPNDTPDSVVEAAKQAIIDAKGTITHEYSK
jgi:predicted outer membrane protein